MVERAGIDIAREELLTFSQAARKLPKRREGRKPAPSTVHRWAMDGHRGVRLEYVTVGGTRCTSLDALQRFFDRLTELDQSGETAPAPTVTRSKSIKAAERRLGISSN